MTDWLEEKVMEEKLDELMSTMLERLLDKKLVTCLGKPVAVVFTDDSVEPRVGMSRYSGTLLGYSMHTIRVEGIYDGKTRLFDLDTVKDVEKVSLSPKSIITSYEKVSDGMIAGTLWRPKLLKSG
jgi:hypothetical protein